MSKLLDKVCNVRRVRRYSYQPEKIYIHWVRQYFFHKMAHPKEIGAAKIGAFLIYLAVLPAVSALTQNQVFTA